MESGNGGAPSKGVLVPVPDTSDAFLNSILAPLQSAYLYEESKQSFRYKSAVLIKNPVLEEKYNAFRAKRSEAGYSQEDLRETYGFLLFDDVNKAHAIGETGVLTGNGTCTTLGDPRKGVYISMYSDCLDLNRWYHGKSGYIAIIRLTKGKVKQVSENYTQNFTAPTVGFDCHVSEELPSVSAKTSSFLAFERTQYYMYELLNDGSSETAHSPSAACPFAIVSFSYTDTKATLAATQETSEEKKLVCHYLPWRGQLQIGTQCYDVGLRSTAGALIPAKLPPVVKVDRAISMLDLIQLLPKTVFETCFSGEVFLDGLYCSLCEVVSSEAEETRSLSLLLREIKEKDLALPVPLNDGGFLILLHSSHFLTYDDTVSNATEVLKGLFVFPVSQVIQKDTKSGHRKATIAPEILQVLPVLSYAESEAEKTQFDPSEALCEVLTQHMQSYAALINPGLALSPTREVSIFPDQYDVPDAHKHLYSSPEWTTRAWQSIRSYVSNPVSFQLPLSKTSEILAAGQEERREDLDDDVYICLSSPEAAPASPVGMELEDQLTNQESPVNVETSEDSCITSTELQVDLTAVPQSVVPEDLQPGYATKDSEKSDLTVLIKTDTGSKTLLTPPTSDDLSAELIVSITSAERTVTDESLSVISTVSAPKHNDFQLSGFSADKLQTAGVNSMHVESVKIKNKDCSEVTNFKKTKRRKRRKGHFRGLKKASKTRAETVSLQTVIIPREDDTSMSQKDDQAKESSGDPQQSNPAKTDWRKLRRRKRKFGKLSSKSKKVNSSTVGGIRPEEKISDPGQQSLEGTILMDIYPLRKKTERWDLKPVVSECGRILVPHGSVDVADHIKSLKDKLKCTKDKLHPEEMLVDAPVNAYDKVEMNQVSSIAPDTTVDRTEATTSRDGGKNLQNNAGSCVITEHSPLRQSDNVLLPLPLSESSEYSSKNDGTDFPPSPPSEAVKERHTDTFSPGKCTTKGEFLLSKLKSVLLRGKRKTDFPVSEGATQDTEPCLKKGKSDSDAEALKSNNAITSAQDTNVGETDVSNMLSVDPLFAYALGLTPKEKPNKVDKNGGQDSQLRKDSSETQEQTILDKQLQIIQRPPSIFTRRGRIKTLKKHQGISAEYIKKKWWLHFQTPACFATEKLKNKECTSDNSVRKTVKEKMNSACSSTDALNLLADLALSANNDQIPSQPDPALDRKPETRSKKCGLTKDVTSAEQESVLHALLRQPAARPIQPSESPSPSHLVGDSEMVGLISKEHAYSLPPSSPLLLGLSGTPFQVSPLSGSTRLLHHHQQLFGDVIQTLQSSVYKEDRGEQNHRTTEYLKKQMVRRHKFRHSRTFVKKDGSIQVTRQWNDNYDFNKDSKFTSDSMDKAIIRALHGPWDFSIQDTTEEVRLIVHMWIGLFYSRSTARFFHIDSNCTYPCSEESDSVEMPSGTFSASAHSALEANSFGPFPSVTDIQDPSISKALDLSKKDNSVLDQGSVILDLSLRSSSAETVTSDAQVNRKETSVSGEECQTMVCSTEITEGNDIRSIYENDKTCPSQSAGCCGHSDIPFLKGDGPLSPHQEDKESVFIQTENYQSASGMLNECNKEKTPMAQMHATDSPRSMADKEVESNKEADEVINSEEHGKTESKGEEKWQVKDNPSQEDSKEPSPKVIHTGDDPANKESDIVCKENSFEDEKQLSGGEPKAVSSGQAETVNEDVDCCTGKMITNEDHFGKDDGFDDKDSCVSAVKAQSELNDPLLTMMCDGPDLVEKDYITDCSHQAPFDEQPCQADNEEDVCHDLQLRKLSPNSSALTDEDAISEKAPHTPTEIEPVYNEPAVEENSENICLADKVHYQKAALPISEESTCSLDGSCVTGSVPLIKDCLEIGSQNKVMTTCSSGLSSDEHEDQETKSEESCVAGSVPQTKDGLETGSQNTVMTTCISGRNSDEHEDQENKSEESCVADSFLQTKDSLETGSQNTVMTTIKFGLSSDEHEDQETKSEESCVAGSVPQTKDSLEIGSKNTVMTTFSFGLNSDGHEDQETKSEESCVAGSVPQTKDSLETGSKNTVMTTFSFGLNSDDHEDQETKSEESCVAGSVPQTKDSLETGSQNTVMTTFNLGLNSDEHEDQETKSEESCVPGSVPQTEDSLETGSQNTVMTTFSFGLNSDEHEDQETNSAVEEGKDDNATQEEQFHHQSHSQQCEVLQKSEAEETLTEKTDPQMNKTVKTLERSHTGVVIPFIGIDISGEDIIQTHISCPQVKVEEPVQGEKGIPFISETSYSDLLTEVWSTSEMYTKKEKLSAGKISLSDLSETNQPVVFTSESYDRCPTPTVDEKPYECIPCSGPSNSTSAFSSSETCKNITQKYLSRSSTPVRDEMPLEQNPCHKSTVNSDPYPHYGLRPDLELRTLRVLQTIDKFLSKSNHTDKSRQIETADMKNCINQTSDLSSKYIPTCLAPSHTSADFEDKKIRYSKPAVVSASTSQNLHKESSDDFLISPFKSKLEEVLGVRLQLKKTDSSLPHCYQRTERLQETSIGQGYCHSYPSFPSTECLQTTKSNIDQDRHKTTPQSNSNHELRSYNQRPVMAVKPSKSDENQAECITTDGQIEYYPKNKQTTTPVVTYTTPTTMFLEKKMESFKSNSGLKDDKKESNEFSTKSGWSSNVHDNKSNSDKAKFTLLEPPYQYQGRDISKFNNILPSSSTQSFESAKRDGHQGFQTYRSFEKVGQTTEEDIEMDQKDCSEASTSFVDYRDNGTIDNSLILGPENSLTCTVYNTSRKRSYSFLEQVSQRCLQDDLTQASMEQECLIFSEQMKQLLKRCKREPICQQDTLDRLRMSCASPVTVHFSSLEEQEDSLDLLDAPSLIGQKIKVDMSDRNNMANSTEEENSLNSLNTEKCFPGTGNLKEHAGITSVTAECSSLYEAMMDDVCAVRKVPSRPKLLRMDRSCKKTEPINHFDFCDQMKREMDESFRSNLNSVVKKSCKAKYRFYILVTSDDALFEETKAQLEAEGHTAVQPSEFFLGEGSSSSLLIILRNEDIAEHICEVPHLLELKKSPAVQFAGIDEPDDVVNLTHQELFMRGGFIMFDRAALEPLSLCNMKKVSEILQGLSSTGKWKWMLHYRDSRRLKENARSSTEAKEKKHFLHFCQDMGILEVLPYHECDLMSRDQADYLKCLVRLQHQNISARYPIFITDTTTDSAFGRNGILTMTLNSFLTNCTSETFSV